MDSALYVDIVETISTYTYFNISNVAPCARGVAASRLLGRQDLMAYKVLVLTLGSMITIPMVSSM